MLFWLCFFFALALAQAASLKDYKIEPDISDPRIVGGKDTTTPPYRHQISLRYKSLFTPEDPYHHICGGSIIDAHMIATAAHCVIATVPSQLKVVAGTDKRRGSDGVIVPVKDIIMHENYNPQTFDNDVALLLLSEPLPLNNFTIGKVELNNKEPKEGLIAEVTGWGAISWGGPPSEQLQEVKVPIVSNEACNEDYDGTITDSMLCAGVRDIGGKDACQGDSGGPLLVNRKLAGIVSWGNGCALAKYPGVYSKVNYLLPWIHGKMTEHIPV